MKLLDEMINKKAELQIAPLIDVVFLLFDLFYGHGFFDKKGSGFRFYVACEGGCP